MGLLQDIQRMSGSNDPTSRQYRNHITDQLLERVYNYPRRLEALKSSSKNKFTATVGTRRSAKTTGEADGVFAKTMYKDNFKVQIITNRLEAATQNWIRPLLKRLDQFGFPLKYINFDKSANLIKGLQFPWGSEIRVFDVEHKDNWENKKGSAAHLYWADEAQIIKQLPAVMAELVNPTLADYSGKVVLTGTPGAEVDSYFGQIATGADNDWTCFYLGSWHNPHFGDTFEKRWRRIFDEIIYVSKNSYALKAEELELIRSLTEDQLNSVLMQYIPEEISWIKSLDRNFLREMLGFWITDRGQLVYPWGDVDYWAEKPFGSIKEAVDQLPRIRGTWNAVTMVDFGFSPHPAAWVIVVWAEGHPWAYEIHSSKMLRMDDDMILIRTANLLQECQHAGLNLFASVADLDGARTGTRHSFDSVLYSRLGIGLLAPDKRNRQEKIRALGIDIKRHTIKVIKNSELDIEGRHLRWHETKVGEEDKDRTVTTKDGKTIIPGDHCLDALRYGHPYIKALGQENTPLDNRSDTLRRIERVFGDDSDLQW